MEHVLWLEGEWGEDKTKVNLVNVYAPCDGRRKATMWRELTFRMKGEKGESVCLMGYFNAIRDKS